MIASSISLDLSKLDFKLISCLILSYLLCSEDPFCWIPKERTARESTSFVKSTLEVEMQQSSGKHWEPFLTCMKMLFSFLFNPNYKLDWIKTTMTNMLHSFSCLTICIFKKNTYCICFSFNEMTFFMWVLSDLSFCCIRKVSKWTTYIFVCVCSIPCWMLHWNQHISTCFHWHVEEKVTRCDSTWYFVAGGSCILHSKRHPVIHIF